MNCSCSKTNMPDREALMLRIQQTDFMLVDLQLYLDNHPGCQAALEDFNRLACTSRELKEEYRRRWGALMNFGADEAGEAWTWTDDSWPWDCIRR